MAIQHEWKLNIPESINTLLDQHQFQYFIFFCIFIIFEFVLTNGKFENPLNWHDTSLFFQWNRSQMYHMLLVTSYSLFNLQILYLLNLWSKIEPLLSLLFATWSRTICCTHIPRINQNNFISTKKYSMQLNDKYQLFGSCTFKRKLFLHVNHFSLSTISRKFPSKNAWFLWRRAFFPVQINGKRLEFSFSDLRSKTTESENKTCVETYRICSNNFSIENKRIRLQSISQIIGNIFAGCLEFLKYDNKMNKLQ